MRVKSTATKLKVEYFSKVIFSVNQYDDLIMFSVGHKST